MSPLLPVEGKFLVITRVLREGIFLTDISKSAFASTNEPSFPSSIKTAYPVIEQPPLKLGSFHDIVIDEVLVLTSLGYDQSYGAEHGCIEVIDEVVEAPLKLYAVTVNL